MARRKRRKTKTLLQQFPLMTYDSYTTYVGGVS
jgi:hypothetical protein